MTFFIRSRCSQQPSQRKSSIISALLTPRKNRPPRKAASIHCRRVLSSSLRSILQMGDAMSAVCTEDGHFFTPFESLCAVLHTYLLLLCYTGFPLLMYLL